MEEIIKLDKYMTIRLHTREIHFRNCYFFADNECSNK